MTFTLMGYIQPQQTSVYDYESWAHSNPYWYPQDVPHSTLKDARIAARKAKWWGPRDYIRDDTTGAHHSRDVSDGERQPEGDAE